jgi:hypothetical protein
MVRKAMKIARGMVWKTKRSIENINCHLRSIGVRR